MRFAIALALGGCCLVGTVRAVRAAPKGPVKVFILAGQSNMEGKAAAYTLEAVIADPYKGKPFQHLRKDGQWTVRDDVWVTFLSNRVRGDRPLYGPLTVGFGSEKQIRDKDNRKINVPGMGPELGIGHVLGGHFDEQVLLIKAAWGGRALKYGFRPPSAIPSDAQIQAEVDAINQRRREAAERARTNPNPKRRPKPVPPPLTFEEHKAGYGADYRAILAETRKVLDHIENYFPEYDPKEGYEIAGFIWFQGWNDAVGEGNPHYVEQMAHFIRDIRRDLGAPEIPFVIGELGTDGPGAQGWIATFRRQQAEIAALEEFQDNVRLAKTAEFWPADLPDLSQEWEEFRAAARKNEETPKEDPTRVDPGEFYNRNWQQKYKSQLSFTSDKRYHYHGSGACYYQMGQSMGKAMVELLR
jgi:alpha-galactosidase